MRRLHLLLLLGTFALIWGSASPAAADCLVVTPCPPPIAPEDPPPAEEPPAEEPAPPADAPPAPPPAPAPAPGSTDDAGAARLLELMNEERRRAGVAPLTRRPDVDGIAVDHSGRMAAAGRIWHNDAYFTSETRTRLAARTLGENVASNASVEDAHRRLMASPGHRRNMLAPAFRVVGIGVVRGESSWFVAQNFVEPRAQAAAAPPVPVRQGVTPATARAPRGRSVARSSAQAVVVEAPTSTSAAVPAPRPSEPDPAVLRLSRGAVGPTSGAHGTTSAEPAPVMVAGAAVAAAAGLLRSRGAWR